MANYPEIELYIDGRWKRASGQPVINPADESVLGTVPTATTADLDDALAAAERGLCDLAQDVARQTNADHPEGREPHPPAR
jgi:acyl-CoA reductase-like NAD-dependent aldehyde dehydrogenase